MPPLWELKIVDCRLQIATRVEAIWVAHASRVQAKPSRVRELFREDCFGETPKPTRETRAFPKQKMPDGFWPSGISMCSSKD
jgi:hypothetical protein